MSSNGRIDIVVFPNGGREIIGRISSDPEVSMSILIEKVNSYVASLTPLAHPKKFTSYYNPDNLDDMIWEDYNENNPIIQIDKADLGIPYDSKNNDNIADVPNSSNGIANISETIAVELASIPVNIAEKYNIHNF